MAYPPLPLVATSTNPSVFRQNTQLPQRLLTLSHALSKNFSTKSVQPQILSVHSMAGPWWSTMSCVHSLMRQDYHRPLGKKYLRKLYEMSAFASMSPAFHIISIVCIQKPAHDFNMEHPELLTITFSSYVDTGVYLRNKFAWGLHVYVLCI
jgi:hypothetical protein